MTDKTERDRRMWDPDRVVNAMDLVDRPLTFEEIEALEYHRELPETLPEGVRRRV